MMLLRVVDDRAVELLGEHVPHDTDGEVRLLEHHRGSGGGLDALLKDLVEAEEVFELALHVGLAGTVCGGTDDQTALLDLELRGESPQPLTVPARPTWSASSNTSSASTRSFRSASS